VRIVVGLAVVAIGIGAFYGGRASKDERPAVTGSYAAGREAAFNGFDGGWSYGQPYIVVLKRGGPGVTYQFASRRPLLSGLEYRRCGKLVCVSHAQ
jgi:hypothetical protein